MRLKNSFCPAYVPIHFVPSQREVFSQFAKIFKHHTNDKKKGRDTNFMREEGGERKTHKGGGGALTFLPHDKLNSFRYYRLSFL